MGKISRDRIKSWFVTGASSGLGQELCRQLVRRGYNVVAVARRVPEINLDGGSRDNLLCLSCDVTKPEDIKSAIDSGMNKFGGIDVLANFAGISSGVTFEEIDDAGVREVMETNYWGTYNTCKALIKYFRENNKGTIVNCTSIQGLVPRYGGTGYNSSKFAVEGLSGAIWIETRKLNTRIMCVEPGLFPTNIGRGRWRKTEFEAYRLPPEQTQIMKVERPFRNDNAIAVNSVIDTVEMEKLPRRLMLGLDCIARVKHEQRTVAREIKYSEKVSKKIARIKDGDRQFTCNDYAQYKSRQSKFARRLIRVTIKCLVDKKRYKKLKRDPNRFFNDSRNLFIRFLGGYYQR